jgi:hypothetical protein
MRKLKIVLLLLSLVFMITTASAWSEFLDGFNRQYGTTDSRLDSCYICHDSLTRPACDEQCHNGRPEKIPDNILNSYGKEIKKRKSIKMDQAFEDTEKIDSGDGSTYIQKIQNLTLPKEKIKDNKKFVKPSVNVSFFKRFFGYVSDMP